MADGRYLLVILTEAQLGIEICSSRGSKKEGGCKGCFGEIHGWWLE